MLGRGLGVGVERAGGDEEEGAASAAGLEIAAAAATPRAEEPPVVERERRELVRGGMAAEPKREEEGGMAKVVGAGLSLYIDGREFWETRGGNARRGARRASERELPVPVGLLLLPLRRRDGFRFVLGSRG